jgi:hypothetical protein
MTMELISFADLHDATLVRVEVQWASGDVTVDLRTGIRKHSSVQIKAASVRNLHCPRFHPWGASASINEIRGPAPLEDGIKRLEVEIQSGDTLVIEATDFELVAQWGARSPRL